MRRATVVAVCVLLLCGLFATPVAVVAQEAADGADGDGSEADEHSTVVADLDSQIRITSYSYDDENATMSVTFENQGVTTSAVTLTEAISSEQAGAGSFGIETVRIRGGETTTVEISVQRVDRSAGVMITSDESLRNGQGVYLQDVEAFEFGLFEGAPNWSTVWFGVGVALMIVGMLSLLAAWQYVATFHDDVDDVEIKGGSA